ncbi:hypothetical protein EK904_014843 [Melospiza melodia maxima]|nr:hypothetical protein EK904_014843 [Melospiza melodia maxima]
MEARDKLLRKMAMTNANPDTKKVLRALPQDPEPSITQMATTCTKATSIEQTVAVAFQQPPRCPGNGLLSVPRPCMMTPNGRLQHLQTINEDQFPDGSFPRLRAPRAASGQLDPSLCQVLHSSVTIMLSDEDFVRVPAGYLEPPFHNRAIEVLLVGDNKHMPFETTVIPEVVTIHPFNEITVSASCTTPPYTLCKHSPFAQMYMLLGQDCDSPNYDIYFTQTLSRGRPNISATISYKEKSFHFSMMADTGVDVTIIPRAKWPCDWELVSSCGTVSSIGKKKEEGDISKPGRKGVDNTTICPFNQPDNHFK